MIKVGDKFKDELKEWTVCEVYRGAALAFSGNITREFSKQYIYTIMYLEQKQRADELEKHIRIMRDNYSEINKDAQTILRTAPDDVLLKAQIRWNNDVIKILDKILEDNNA